MTIKNLYPASRPSLDLNFAATKRLDPRVTFSRASTATYYDGQTQAKAEENLFPYSQDFSDAAWQKFVGTVTSNDTTAPDGTATADTFLGGATTNTQGVRGTRLAFTGSSVISVFAKAGTASVMQIAFDGDVAPFANFDLSTGTVGTVGTGITTSVISAGSGWYRCVAIITSGTATNVYFTVQTSTSAARLASTTSPGSISLWGAQYEQRAALTAYTPTVASPVTRYMPQLLTAAANQPRFDHNPVTGESLGLLIEENRANLLTYSEQFDNAAWVTGNATILSNQTISPFGGLTADAFIENSTTNNHSTGRNVTGLAANTYTLTVFAKASGRSNLVMAETGSTFGRANFNLASGTVASTAGPVSASIQSLPNGWCRCSIQSSIPAGGTFGVALSLAIDSSSPIYPSYTGDGISGVYIWGAQLEAGAFPTSYIPTIGTSLTRVGDAATITGANFSSWYNNAEGTLYAEMEWPSIALVKNNAANIVGGNAGIGNQNNGWFRPYVGTAIPSPRFLKVALAQTDFRYGNSSNYSMASNGTVGNFGGPNIAIGSGPPINLQIGQCDGNVLNAPIRKITYWPIRLSNATLQNITY